MKHICLGLILTVFFNQSILVSASNKLMRDCEILKGIYDSYKIKNFQSDCCDMENIDCEVINSETRMTRLDLSNTGITEIPNNIVNLEELRKINFRGNNLNGEIPSYFSKLPHLEELNLSKNRFYGQIPKSFLDIENLSLLDVSDNRLFGTIPSEFCDMKNLKIIRYHNNMNSVYPSTCIREKFGYKQNNYVIVTRWVVFIGIIVTTVIFSMINIASRQNQIKAKFKRLSQGRFSNTSRDDLEMRKNP